MLPSPSCIRHGSGEPGISGGDLRARRCQDSRVTPEAPPRRPHWGLGVWPQGGGSGRRQAGDDAVRELDSRWTFWAAYDRLLSTPLRPLSPSSAEAQAGQRFQGGWFCSHRTLQPHDAPQVEEQTLHSPALLHPTASSSSLALSGEEGADRGAATGTPAFVRPLSWGDHKRPCLPPPTGRGPRSKSPRSESPSRPETAVALE